MTSSHAYADSFIVCSLTALPTYLHEWNESFLFGDYHIFTLCIDIGYIALSSRRLPRAATAIALKDVITQHHSAQMAAIFQCASKILGFASSRL